MKHTYLKLMALLFATIVYAQSGHIMQGVGSVNMSMGGAATGQALDISGALQWNPASISSFDENILKFDIGFFYSSPELRASFPENFLWQPDDFGPGSPGSPAVMGVTEDDRGMSLLPNIAFVWSKPESKHTFGVSAFGISGFGVTFPEDNNVPFDMDFNPNPNWNPNDSNPINWPQPFGFGRIESNYMLLQVGFTWAYELSDKFSIGIQPNIDWAALELMPNPTAVPAELMPGAWFYPKTDNATALGFGAQVGVYYDSGSGFKAGASYKSPQSFGDFEFENTYPDGSTGENKFNMDYPAIYSVGLGYSAGDVDLALDYRLVDYENTDGFSTTGWTQTASVAGFGWENISIVSAGIQYKGIEDLPLRLGYTYSTNPIPDEVAFFNTPATAIIKNAFQFGLSYEVSDAVRLDGVFHYGTSSGDTSGPILSPEAIMPGNPLGALPGTEVAYDMTTSMVMVGLNYTFKPKESED